MGATALRTRLREAVSGTATPQLQRGEDDDVEDEDDRDTEPEDEPKKGEKKRTRERLLLVLREASLTRKGKAYEVTVVREGPGNPHDANYYTKQALSKAVSDGMFEGLQAYLNHPTPTEERERPERDVRFLAGHFREARYVDGSPAEVRAKFIPGGMDRDRVVELIESALESHPDRPLVGISIDGFGHAPDQGDVGGRTYNMVREIAHLGSADIVTRAGAGGKFHRRLQEAWRAAEDDMKLSEAKLSRKQRKSLKKSQFAIPEKAPGSGSYPIPDESHARNALTRVAQHGTPEEQRRVRAAVKRKFPNIDVDGDSNGRSRESDPAVRAGATSKEVRMKPAKLQEKTKAAVAKLREASGLDDEDQADRLIQEALGELEECVTADITEKIREVEVEVEKPVAATDSDVDKLAAENADLERKLHEAETARDTARQDATDARDELNTLQRAQLASKIVREADVPREIAEDWFDSIVACKDEQSMRALVERKKAAADALVRPFREALGVEGAGARLPIAESAPAGGGDLLDRLGLDREEYLPSGAAA